MEMSRSEGKRKRIQMTRHNEGTLKAGAGKPLNGDLSGWEQYLNWLKLWYLTVLP